MINGRIGQALRWYDDAVKKYEAALEELAKYRADAEFPGGAVVSENDLIRRARDRVRRYEEKLARMSAILANVTTTTKILMEQEKDEEDD